MNNDPWKVWISPTLRGSKGDGQPRRGHHRFPRRHNVDLGHDPCKCGYFVNPKRECRCSPRKVENYRNRISGPLLDRIDIHVEASAVEFKELSRGELIFKISRTIGYSMRLCYEDPNSKTDCGF